MTLTASFTRSGKKVDQMRRQRSTQRGEKGENEEKKDERDEKSHLSTACWNRYCTRRLCHNLWRVKEVTRTLKMRGHIQGRQRRREVRGWLPCLHVCMCGVLKQVCCVCCAGRRGSGLSGQVPQRDAVSRRLMPKLKLQVQRKIQQVRMNYVILPRASSALLPV